MSHRIRLEPAASVIAILGFKVITKVTGISRSGIWRWTQPEPVGTGGLVPSKHQDPLLSWAKKNRKPLTAEIIIRGRTRKDCRRRKRQREGHILVGGVQ